MSHRSEDYKITAVRYYLDNETSYAETCRIFRCSERSLKRWINRYNTEENVNRKNRRSVSYKITQKHVKYAVEQLKKNEQITMFELAKLVKKKYDDFNLSWGLLKCKTCIKISMTKQDYLELMKLIEYAENGYVKAQHTSYKTSIV
jgi:transposase